TKRSRGTWHAWHFQSALCLVVKVLCGHFCIACLRPLTRRYTFGGFDMPARMDEYLDKVIKNRFSVSLMSNAKWRKVFTVLDVPELMLNQCYWKFVDNDYEFLGWFTKSDELMEKYVGDYGSGPFAYKRIEWLEIPKVGKPGGYENVPFKHWHQDIDGALSILNSVGHFDIELTDRGLRIYGFRE
ncbi:DUF6678 family protein, partial [Vibrio parahaemolyticus]|uniref:DUF6678 family protein n=3 Tax=Vibrio TaxID=662 RepID=UPI0035900BF4